MKLIIAGGRDLTASVDEINSALDEVHGSEGFEYVHEIIEIVSGCATGIDTSGELFAESHNIPIRKFVAKWDKYFGRAGHIRNRDMALYADALLLIWDGKSVGSANMLQQMRKLNKPVHEVIV